MDIKDRVILVTGASAGIGAAVAKLAAAEGARVALLARRTDRIEALAAQLPDAMAVTADVTDPAQVHAAVAAVVERYGRLDVLVNNAGQGLHLPLEQVRLDDFRAITELNVFAPLTAMQAVLPVMRRQGEGAIVNISSGTSRRIVPGVGSYAATKSALNMLSQVARQEWAADGIVVSLVYPSLTTTEFHDVLRAGALPSDRRTFRHHTAEAVAEVVLDVIRDGRDEAVLQLGH